MKITRRNALLSALLGAGAVGLRSLATGLPISLLTNPRKAFADLGDAGQACANVSKAQFIIMSTSASGDPINANCPGTYGDPNIMHPSDPSMAPTQITLGGQPYTAAKPWTNLPQDVLDRTTFWHTRTNTFIHPDEPRVLDLMGATGTHPEMLPSLLAKTLAPCLATIQTAPIALGATGPSEALTFNGRTLPIAPPLSLKDTLANPTGPLTQLQLTRDQALAQIYAVYKDAATTPDQRAYVDSLVTSHQQIRGIEQNLLASLGSITSNDITAQCQAAITLIQMKLAPVFTVHMPFGGDNHQDTNLAAEVKGTNAGTLQIAALMAALKSAGLQDQVTFMTFNVFGRTLAQNQETGRGHNGYHHVALTIGKPFKPGVVGGVQKASEDYGCTGIDASTGSSTSGDIQPVDTMAAFAQTMLAAVGGDTTSITSDTGKVITGALASP